jgi:hypothetical protein
MIFFCSTFAFEPALKKNTEDPYITKSTLFIMTLIIIITFALASIFFCFFIKDGPCTFLFKVVILVFNAIIMIYIIFLFYMFLFVYMQSGIGFSYEVISENWSKATSESIANEIKTQYLKFNTLEINNNITELLKSIKELDNYISKDSIAKKVSSLFNSIYGKNPNLPSAGSLVFNVNNYTQELDNILLQQTNIKSNTLNNWINIFNNSKKTIENIQMSAKVINDIHQNINLSINLPIGGTAEFANIINKQLKYFSFNSQTMINYGYNLNSLPLGLYNITFFQDFDSYLDDCLPYNAKESIFLTYLQSQTVSNNLKTISINQITRGICFNLSNSNLILNTYFINKNGKIYFFVFLNNILILCSNGFIVYFTSNLSFSNYSFKTETKVTIFDVLENSFRFYSLLSTPNKRSSTYNDVLIMVGPVNVSSSLFYEVFQKVDEQFFDSFQNFQLNNGDITFSSSVNDGIIHNINSILGSIQIIYKYNSVNLILNNTQVFSLTLNENKFSANINNQTILLNEKS